MMRVEEGCIELWIGLDVGIGFAEDIFAIDEEFDASGDEAAGKPAIVVEAGVIGLG